MTSLLGKLMRPFSNSTMHLGPQGNAQVIPEGAARATIAAGCFWGVEKMYRQAFKGKGLYDAKVGYIGGSTSNPTYRQVCGGDTNHAEALQVIYDPQQLTYRQLLEFFFRMHDPTQKNRQGNDRGTQYRSAIFPHDDEQKQVAETIKAKVQKEWFPNKRVETLIEPAGEWWDAEAYHQRYLDKNPSGYECEAHFLRKDLPPLSE